MKILADHFNKLEKRQKGKIGGGKITALPSTSTSVTPKDTSSKGSKVKNM